MNEQLKTLLPKLQFPEFRSNQKWEVIPLSSVSDVRDGTHDSPKFYDIGKPLLTSKNLLKDGSLDTVNVSFISDSDFEQINKRSKVDIGDILFGMIGTIGNPVMVKTDGFAIKNIALIKQKTDLLNSYLVQLLNSDYITKEFSILNTGNSQKFIALGQIRSLNIPAPSLLEQQKIADCFSSLDDLITAKNQKVEALKQHKKGLMQQLFPAEGETVPKLRFPEFENDGEWMLIELNKLGELISGLTYSPEDVRESGLLVLRSSNVQNGQISQNDNVYVTTDIKGANLVKPNDILICVRNGSKTLIGKNALIPDDMPLCTHGAFMTVFRAKTPSFVFQLFQTDAYQKQVDGDLGATINSINGSKFLKYKFWVPQKPNEQKRIAECLSSLDDLIITQTQRLEAYKTHKKGLMQQLFPSLEEVA